MKYYKNFVAPFLPLTWLKTVLSLECCIHILFPNGQIQNSFSIFLALATEQSNNEENGWYEATNVKKIKDVSDHIKESPKDQLRRAGSTKYRRRRDGVVISGSGGNVLDILSRQLEEVGIAESTHVSDSECTTRPNRRRKTRSLDKSDTWSVTPDSPNR